VAEDAFARGLRAALLGVAISRQRNKFHSFGVNLAGLPLALCVNVRTGCYRVPPGLLPSFFFFLLPSIGFGKIAEPCWAKFFAGPPGLFWYRPAEAAATPIRASFIA
jgi:hypothetical protein